MSKPTPPETPSLSVGGDVSGQAIAGRDILQIREIHADTVHITPPGQRPEPLLPYTPPPPPDPDTLPDPGPLPPGSCVTFYRNALFTGREEPLKDLARALLHGEKPSTLVTQAVQGMGAWAFSLETHSFRPGKKIPGLETRLAH